jgi:ankyrin repeat protein
MARCDGEANTREECYWKLVSTLVVNFKGKAWVKTHIKWLRNSSSILPLTDEEGQRYYDLIAAVCLGDMSIFETIWDEPVVVDSPHQYVGTALYVAASLGNIDAAHLLLDAGADPNVEGNVGTCLATAAYHGSADIAQLLLDNGAEAACQTLQKETPLLLAAKRKHSKVVEVLLQNELTDPNARDRTGRTPLHWAAENNDPAVAKMLIRRRVICVNTKVDSYSTPLLRAVVRGHEEVLTVIASHETCNFQFDAAHGNPLRIASAQGYEGCLRVLLQKYDLQPKRDPRIVSDLLCRAAYNGNIEVARLLLERDDIDVNFSDETSLTALYSATLKGHEAIVRLLLQVSDIQPNKFSGDGQTALFCAVQSGHDDIAKMLLECPAVDPNDGGPQWSEETPLHAAAHNGSLEIAEMLLMRGAIADSVNRAGEAPLAFASLGGHENVVRLLLAQGGVDPQRSNRMDIVPLHRAAAGGHTAIVRLVLECGVDVNVRDGTGSAALVLAARWGHVEVVRLLLEQKGIRAKCVDKNGRTPVCWARRNGHAKVAELLEPH